MPRKSKLPNKPIATMDEIPTAILTEELRAIEAEVMHEVNGPQRSAELIPFKTDIPAGAESWSFDKITSYGVSEWLSAKPGSVPLAEVTKERKTYPLFSHGIGYEMTVDDFARAAMSGMPIENERARAAKIGADVTRDRTLINGNTQFGWSGLINEDSVTILTAAGTFASLTADQIISEVGRMVDTLRIQCGDQAPFLATGLTLVLPDPAYRLVRQPRANTDTTVEQFLLKNFPEISQIRPLSELNGAGTSGTDRAMLYKIDPMVVVALFALLYSFQGEERSMFGVKRGGKEKMGGLAWRFPLGALYMDGV